MHQCSTILKTFLVISFCVWVYGYGDVGNDKPCAARSFPGKSVVCVCNATYCDTVTRVWPTCGTYVAYTSSKAGLRFKKTYGRVEKFRIPGSYHVPVLELDPDVLYQEISGFGGAVTDSAGINWNSLKDEQARQHLVDAYFSKKGIEYNMMRIPIGGTDFSLRPYAYNDDTIGDSKLEYFKLAAEDYDYKIPFIKACLDVSTAPVRAVASLWSPPPWMKTSNELTSGFLKKEYYQTLADYFLKFIDSYNECDIPIWGITTTNEPLNAVYVSISFNRLQWTVGDMGTWISDYLGPTIRNSTYKFVKIITGDDQRNTIPIWFNNLVETNTAALQYIDGVAVHFYYDKDIPATQLTQALRDYPDKFILYTEASTGVTAPANLKVDLGNWSRGESYAYNIIEDLNHKVIGWIDWNMCLNETGGPTWIGNRIDSPIIVSVEKQEFYKQPMYYAIGHFSKFIPRGSRRLKADMRSSVPVAHAAFLTPQKTIVVVLLNKGTSKEVVISLGIESAAVLLEPKSFTTVEFPYQSLSRSCYNKI